MKSNLSKQPGELIVLHFVLLTLFSCSVQKKIAKSAIHDVLNSPALKTAHVGISIYEPETNAYWFNYQGDKYFVPASNTKIPTCYAAMKYLGDSLVGFTYDELPGKVIIQPNGDPSLLLNEFQQQPAIEFLKKLNKPVSIDLSGWKSQPLGSGWSWNDYEEYYMAERSAMPLYGNIMQFSGMVSSPNIIPAGAINNLIFDTSLRGSYVGDVHRSRTGNHFTVIGGAATNKNLSITFDTQNEEVLEKLLSDTLKIPVHTFYANHFTPNKISGNRSIKTQPTDSLLKPMMHRSDNFFAEQSLLMVSNKMLGYMDDSRIIDTILNTDFKDLPQKPRWVDGSGLSRYNLFTPQDFVAILHKMKNEFGMDRIREILPTGGEGTIRGYYKQDSGYIYAKTGTLSGVVALSGFLYTRKNKLLIYSILVNNHRGSATEVRRAVEKFVQGVRNK